MTIEWLEAHGFVDEDYFALHSVRREKCVILLIFDKFLLWQLTPRFIHVMRYLHGAPAVAFEVALINIYDAL